MLIDNMLKLGMAPTRDQIIALLRQQMPFLKREYHVKSAALFGSYAKGTQRDDSDVDILVEFDGFVGLKFVHLADHLELLFGRKVDVVTKGGIDSIRHRDVAESIKRDLTYA